MAELAAMTILKYAEKQQRCNEPVRKIGLDVDQLKQLNAPDGKSLGDHVALMVGTLGENATLRRAMVLTAAPNLYLTAYAHPSGQQKNNVLLGKIGGIVALRQSTRKDVNLSDVGKNICQHVVGMNPKKVGSVIDEPSINPEEESCLIYQDYLLDESLQVKDFLEENGVEVVDFCNR
ncbi:hypothetical protein AMK59_7215 [Oryctes borbonicus]|uniref:Translation elongation factor EFTs/EF1B dimerisation domain-containing protein n=1 Tax=Oryctes borbonicus TaxID=1629725 RepID=A0A0T6AU24_9SCAR|nr:hypothetical protein AMK59_7215 [Oryctes borbonicus]